MEVAQLESGMEGGMESVATYDVTAGRPIGAHDTVVDLRLTQSVSGSHKTSLCVHVYEEKSKDNYLDGRGIGVRADS